MVDEEILRLQSEVAGLRLSLEEAMAAIEKQNKQAKEAEQACQTLMEARMEARLKQLFGELASPMAQLQLQQWLVEQGKDVKPGNIFKLVAALGNALEEAGMKKAYTCGERAGFNAHGMAFLTHNSSCSEGESVVVRIPACIYKEQYL